ncbi:hypothetical protein IAT40_007357 [Kwoniella sp. CBS 6097]
MSSSFEASSADDVADQQPATSGQATLIRPGSYQKTLRDFETLQGFTALADEATATSRYNLKRWALQSPPPGRAHTRQFELVRGVEKTMAELALRERVGCGITSSVDATESCSAIHVHISVLPPSVNGATYDDSSNFIRGQLLQSFADQAARKLILNAARGENTVVDGPWLQDCMVETLLPWHCAAASHPAVSAEGSGFPSRQWTTAEPIQSSLKDRSDLGEIYRLVDKRLTAQQDGSLGFRPNPSVHSPAHDPMSHNLTVSPAQLSDQALRASTEAVGIPTESAGGSVFDSVDVPKSEVPNCLALHYKAQQDYDENNPSVFSLGDGMWKPHTDLRRVLTRSRSLVDRDSDTVRPSESLDAITIEIWKDKPNLPTSGWTLSLSLPQNEGDLTAYMYALQQEDETDMEQE